MSNSRFNELLKRYINDEPETRLSDDEYQELMGMIREGTYESSLNAQVTDMLASEPFTMLEMERANAIVNKIVSSKRTVPLYKRPWAWAAAAVFAIACISALLMLQNTVGSEPASIAVNRKVENSHFTGRQLVRLPDGSTALLSDNSTLAYEESFGGKDRVVTLSGVAYFDIAHDATRPFKVVTGNVTTTVLGTAFNISAPGGTEGSVVVTVTRGKVSVSDNSKPTVRELAILTPNQQLTVNLETSVAQRTDSHVADAIEWKKDYLIFDNISMEAAAAIIEERYNAKVIFNNESIKRCPITATFLSGENLDQILTVVSSVIKAEYKIQSDGNIYLDGRGCSE